MALFECARRMYSLTARPARRLNRAIFRGRDSGSNVVAIDPALPFEMAGRLSAARPALRLQDASSVVNGCRMYKSAAELALMQHAKNLTLEVHRRAARMLTPGISTKEVRRFIDDAHRTLGTSGNTFCIVHFAEATAYPHGLPGEQLLRENDIVLIDTGCCVEGYNSDCAGEPDRRSALGPRLQV